MAQQTFFNDPAMDRMMGVIVALASELHLTRSRCRALEGVLVDAGLIKPTAVEQWAPDDKRRAEADAELNTMMKSLFDRCVAS